MRKIYFLLGLLLFTACEDGRQVDMDIDSVVYILNSGLQSVTLDNSNLTYDLWLYKGGYNDDQLTVMLTIDEQALNTYNEENGTSYVLMPSSCYSFKSTTITLGKSGDLDYSDYTTVTFSNLSDLSSGNSYVLPVSISCDNSDLINEDKSTVLLKINME